MLRSRIDWIYRQIGAFGMRITAITDEISQDLGHALGVLKEYGATSCELRNVYGVYIVDADDAIIARVQSDLSSSGMTVDCLDTPLFKCNLDADGTTDAAGATHNAAERTLSDQWPLLDRCIELALKFKTPYMRIFAFWRKGDLTADRRTAIIEILTKASGIAGASGITLLLENEHACLLGTAAETADVVQAIGSPWLKMVWDPGNAMMLGEAALPDGYDVCKDVMVHIHLKDVAIGGDQSRSWACIGAGNGQYPELFQTLAESGYTGSVALETHWKSSDNNPETASRACLAVMQQLLG